MPNYTSLMDEGVRLGDLSVVLMGWVGSNGSRNSYIGDASEVCRQ